VGGSRAAAAFEPDDSIITPAIQLAAVLVLDEERGQCRQDGVSHGAVSSA
jgi:hypothetical protein